jgi:hypothetical protein
MAVEKSNVVSEINVSTLINPAAIAVFSFQNEHIIHENEVRCIVKESDFNLSYNPSLLKYGSQPTTSSVDLSNIVVSSSVTPFVLVGVNFVDLYFEVTNNTPNDITIDGTLEYFDALDPSNNLTLPNFPLLVPAGKTTKTYDINNGYTLVWFGTGGTLNITINSATYTSYEIIDSTIKDFATGSAFQPYVTTIGLYNDDDDLLMVAKLSEPIALSADTDMTFIVRYDT